MSSSSSFSSAGKGSIIELLDEDSDVDTKPKAKDSTVDLTDLIDDTESEEEDNDDDHEVQIVSFASAATVAAATAVRKDGKNTSFITVSKRGSRKQSPSDYEIALALAEREKSSQANIAAQSATCYHQKKKTKKAFPCGICLEDNLPSWQGYTLMGCMHRFCINCLVDLIRASINVGGGNSKKSTGTTATASTATAGAAKIICPQDKCKNLLCLSDIQFILRYYPLDFQRYTELADLSRLESELTDESSSTRRCPAEHCNYVFCFVPGTGAEGRPFHCPDCRQRFCLQCGANNHKVGPAHPGLSCAERYQQLKEEAEERRKFQLWQEENQKADQRFQELLKKEKQSGMTLPCPRCKMAITKNGGCNHMYCTNCKLHFNWNGKN